MERFASFLIVAGALLLACSGALPDGWAFDTLLLATGLLLVGVTIVGASLYFRYH
jgi:hypothetical protein